MAAPIPATEVFAFHLPVVKDGKLVLPVTVGCGKVHGIRASLESWQTAAEKILTAAKKTKRGRPLDRVPIFKPSGEIL